MQNTLTRIVGNIEIFHNVKTTSMSFKLNKMVPYFFFFFFFVFCLLRAAPMAYGDSQARG